MPVFILAIIGTLGIIILSMMAGVSGPGKDIYQDEARKATMAAYVSTGTVPTTVTVLGQTVSTAPFAASIASLPTLDNQVNIKAKKRVLEQAMVNVCLTLQARCSSTDITKLWAFLPATTGTMSDLLTNGTYTTANTIDCATATTTDYGNYGRYLLRGAINSTSDIAPEVVNGVTMQYYYGSPNTNTGCGWQDIISLNP